MQYNYSKLIGKIAEMGETRESLCEKIGITSMTLREKLAGKSFFKQNEMAAIMSVLGIDKNDIALYFFDTDF